jgi:hypothetical protein
MFAARQDDPTDGDHVHFGNGVANDRKGVLSDLAIRSKVVRGIDIAVVDLTARNELIDFDRPGAFNLHGIDLLIFHNEYWPFATSYPRAVSSRGTTSPVSESTFCCFKRLPVFRLIRLKLTFSLSDDAG